MPEFLLRSWAEQTLFASRDYRVTADTLEEAVEMLQEAQEEAQDQCTATESDGIRPLEAWATGGVRVLDASEIGDGCDGITLIDEAGNRVRDMTGTTPTGCVPLGEAGPEPLA